MLKKFVKKILLIKPVNYPLVTVSRLLAGIFPENIKKIFYKIPVNRKVKISEKGFRKFFMVTKGNDSIAKDIYWEGLHSYEPRTLNIITSLMMKSDTFIDIGANTGLFSLLAGACSEIGHIHAFEPMDAAYEQMANNIELNCFTNIKANKTALSNFDGESVFNIQDEVDNIPLGSSLREDVGAHSTLKQVKVKTLKLDSYDKLDQASMNILVKIDTEGTEDSVLEGAVNFIDSKRPVMLCEVLSHTGTEPGIHKILDTRQYNYYYVNDSLLEQVEKIKGDPFIVSNYLLMPAEKAGQYTEGFNVSKIKEKIFTN